MTYAGVCKGVMLFAIFTYDLVEDGAEKQTSRALATRFGLRVSVIH